jgi:hypothetical protein
MKHSVAFGLMVSLFGTFAAQALEEDRTGVSPAGKTIGVGLELGAPTNLNAKFMLGPQSGVVVGVGGGIWYDLSLSLHGDYVFHPIALRFDDGTFSAYVGGGLWTSFGFPGEHYGYYRPFLKGQQYFAVGARVPLGLNLAFNAFPIELFLELVPAVALFPGLGVFGQGGLGARIYF